MQMLDKIKRAVDARGRWYYILNDEEVGPVMLQEIREMVEAGRIPSDTPIWAGGRSQSEPASSVLADFPARNDGQPGRRLTPAFVVKSDDAEEGAPSEATISNTLPQAWDEHRPRPWSRLMARYLDIWVSTFVATVAILAFFPRLDYLLTEAPIGMPLMMLSATIAYETLSAAFGIRTIGKGLFNIHVRTAAGKKLTWNDAAARSGIALFVGLGGCIALVSLFTQVIQYRRLVGNGETGYDRKHGYVVTHSPVDEDRRGWFALVIVILISVYFFSLS